MQVILFTLLPWRRRGVLIASPTNMQAPVSLSLKSSDHLNLPCGWLLSLHSWSLRLGSSSGGTGCDRCLLYRRPA